MDAFNLPLHMYVAAAGLLSIERGFYALICHKPKAVATFAKVVTQGKAVSREPEFIFTFVRLFKVVQAFVFLSWYGMNFGTQLPPAPDFGVCALAFLLLLSGQILNALVWYRIGIEGVCYGVKFGRTIPWCTEFPYSHMSDPQYVGAILTVWGMFLLASKGASDWMAIPILETMLYYVSMKVEY